jgi:hypothetical protein
LHPLVRCSLRDARKSYRRRVFVRSLSIGVAVFGVAFIAFCRSLARDIRAKR